MGRVPASNAAACAIPMPPLDERVTCPDCGQDQVTITDKGRLIELHCPVCDWRSFTHPQPKGQRHRYGKPRGYMGRHGRPSD